MLSRLAIQLFGILKFGAGTSRLTGPAWVIDGDTIVVAGERIRLHGIDAPEMDQTFWCRDQELMCGAMALAALEALTAGVRVRCEVIEQDCYGRSVAKCYSPNGIDICRRMVSSGWALAYRRYSTDYVDAEKAARKAKRGLWRGTFSNPWDWRAASAQRALASDFGQRAGLDKSSVARPLFPAGSGPARGR